MIPTPSYPYPWPYPPLSLPYPQPYPHPIPIPTPSLAPCKKRLLFMLTLSLFGVHEGHSGSRMCSIIAHTDGRPGKQAGCNAVETVGTKTAA